MPNWVANHLIIHGENAVEVLRSLLKQNKENESGCGYDLDFNKIIPMPESMNIESGSTANSCVEMYLTSINPVADYCGDSKMDTNEYLKISNAVKAAKKYGSYDDCLTEEEILKREKETYIRNEANELQTLTKEEILKRGKIAVENVLTYGAMDWYDWSIENWGTKWNACDTQIPDDEAADVFFNTAWSPVIELMRELSEQHPECSFEYSYAEEQAGNFAGDLIFQNGEIVEGSEYDSDSKEAYEMFFNLWGGEDAFKFNEKTGTYEYIENEEEM